MSQGSLIRRLNRRKVTLERLTKEALETEQLEPDQKIEILIRRVTTIEVTKRVATPPAFLRAARLRQEAESEEEFKERWRELVEGDEELQAAGVPYAAELRIAILEAGCVAPRVYANDAEIPAGDEDAITISDLGDDADDVYEAIVTFSGLPFSLRSGAGPAGTFPQEPVADQDQPDGEVLRHDPEPAPTGDPR